VTLLTELDAAAVTAELDAGWGLPTGTYTDPDWFQLEQEAIFDDAWYYVGTTLHVPTVGDTLLGWAGRTPVVIVHGRDGELRALRNVCRHRGHTVCTQSQAGLKALACPYHGWTYGLDGALRGAPGSGDELVDEKADLGLAQLRLETWGNQIFVSSAADGPSVTDTFPTLSSVTDRRGFDHDPASYSLHRRYETSIRTNWKIWYDNTIECYHCGLVHSDTFNAAYAADGEFETLIHRHLVSFDFPSRPKDGNELKVSFNRHVHLFPGFLCVQQDDVMIIGQMRPISATETAMVLDVLAETGADPARVDAWADLWWDTFEEDKASVEVVQRNVDSGAPVRNRYIRTQEPVPMAVTRWAWDACTSALEARATATKELQ
jgi:phenylpropionate dioxygenase-like ring-hydroxylating dioxygenase large terminal subunit